MCVCVCVCVWCVCVCVDTNELETLALPYCICIPLQGDWEVTPRFKIPLIIYNFFYKKWKDKYFKIRSKIFSITLLPKYSLSLSISLRQYIYIYILGMC